VRNFFHLSRNTFRECLREPVFFLLLAAALFLIGLFPSVALFVFREQVKLVTDSAMATTLVFGLVAAVLCASHTVTREIRNGTVLLLLSKPVPRWLFIHAKTMGVVAAMSVFVLICAAATVISLRVARDQFRLDYLTFYGYYLLLALAAVYGAMRNYLARKSFAASSTFALLILLPLLIAILRLVKVEGEVPPFPWEILPALTLLFFAVWAMSAITVTLATRLDLTSNLTCSALLFLLGLISDYAMGRFAETSLGGRLLGSALYAVIPNWQFFWMADALAARQPIPWRYIGWAGLYIVLYIAFCSLIAVLLFGGREVGDEPLT